MADYQWYPGHMAKAKRMMQENIRLVDVIIEIIDARVPLSSRNPDIDQLAAGKSRILVMAKKDLADPRLTDTFCRYFENGGAYAIAADARSKQSLGDVKSIILKACRERIERDRKRGIVGRPVRAMVCGIPNVGKSTFINSIAGRASAKTGNKPGVTRGKQWISVKLGGAGGKNAVSLDLLDTPGILWPKFEDPEAGCKLALAGSIRDEILDEYELSLSLLQYLTDRYPEYVSGRYLKDGEQMKEGEELLEQIALSRNLLAKGGGPDLARTAHLLLDDFRNGRTGRITLDFLTEETC